MKEVSIINFITVPEGMENVAKDVRDEYVRYFQAQDGFVKSLFYQSMDMESDGSRKFVNIVVWKSVDHYQRVVNEGFENDEGLNKDGYRVLGKGFPEPITVSPGRFTILSEDADSGD